MTGDDFLYTIPIYQDINTDEKEKRPALGFTSLFKYNSSLEMGTNQNFYELAVSALFHGFIERAYKSSQWHVLT